jgi:hypothetical protein
VGQTWTRLNRTTATLVAYRFEACTPHQRRSCPQHVGKDLQHNRSIE